MAKPTPPSIKLTKRQAEVVLALQNCWMCFHIDTPAMCGTSPALVKGKTVQILRRPLLDKLMELGLVRHPTGLRQATCWDSYVLTDLGKAWKK